MSPRPSKRPCLRSIAAFNSRCWTSQSMTMDVRRWLIGSPHHASHSFISPGIGDRISPTYQVHHGSVSRLQNPSCLQRSEKRLAKAAPIPTSFSRRKGFILAKFRVVDLRTSTIEADQVVEASTPEGAAAAVLGERAVRGGQSLRQIICRVYWDDSAGRRTMVRLYRPKE